MDDEIIRLNLDQQRREYQERLEMEQDEREAETTGPKKMGTGVFLIAMLLACLILGIEWLSWGTLGWLLAVPINIGSWFILRPYNKALKRGKWILGTSLVTDSFPFVGVIPVDMLGIIYVYLQSHSAAAEHLAKLSEKFKNRRNPPSQIAA